MKLLFTNDKQLLRLRTDPPKKLAFLDLIMDNPDFTFEELENEVKIFIIAVSIIFHVK